MVQLLCTDLVGDFQATELLELTCWSQELDNLAVGMLSLGFCHHLSSLCCLQTTSWLLVRAFFIDEVEVIRRGSQEDVLCPLNCLKVNESLNKGLQVGQFPSCLH